MVLLGLGYVHAPYEYGTKTQGASAKGQRLLTPGACRKGFWTSVLYYFLQRCEKSARLVCRSRGQLLLPSGACRKVFCTTAFSTALQKTLWPSFTGPRVSFCSPPMGPAGRPSGTTVGPPRPSAARGRPRRSPSEASHRGGASRGMAHGVPRWYCGGKTTTVSPRHLRIARNGSFSSYFASDFGKSR